MISMQQDFWFNFQPPTVETETVTYDPEITSKLQSTTDVPIVKTESRTVTYETDGTADDDLPGMLVSAQAHSTRTQTIETTTVRRVIGVVLNAGKKQTKIVLMVN